ncbi:hypothetical protein LOK49_LG01G02964 [Camellia lanceoleosa]|uniref:Uncharacterized protein n=1 Tax=Camellia lanceoleosa TaxID=1840588 RepID=A0ACC0J377_9ERIC|nr:hypothetical protein LOK49_LG01G02964 [Camellia lanceoleosa]
MEFVKHLPLVAGTMIDSHVTADYWKNRTQERLKCQRRRGERRSRGDRETERERKERDEDDRSTEQKIGQRERRDRSIKEKTLDDDLHYQD